MVNAKLVTMFSLMVVISISMYTSKYMESDGDTNAVNTGGLFGNTGTCKIGDEATVSWDKESQTVVTVNTESFSGATNRVVIVSVGDKETVIEYNIPASPAEAIAIAEATPTCTVRDSTAAEAVEGDGVDGGAELVETGDNTWTVSSGDDTATFTKTSATSWTGSSSGDSATFECDDSPPDTSALDDCSGERRERALAQVKELVQSADKYDFKNRRLGGGGCNWWSAGLTFFRSGGSFGNWCGKGQANKCTANGKPENNGGFNGARVCADGGFDKSCSKHDSGSHYQDVWGTFTLSWCEVDRNFANERRNSGNGFYDGVDTDYSAINGADCLFSVQPCLRYEAHSSWGWCGSWGWRSSPYPCRKTHTAIVTKWPYGNYPSGGCRGNCYD